MALLSIRVFSTLLLAGLIFTALADATQTFDEWCAEYGKVYPSADVQRERQAVFQSNEALVEQLNEQYRQAGVTFRVNQFADLTSEEFKRTVLMPPRPPPDLPKERYSLKTSHNPQTLPDTFDWRDKGVVTSVKDQGSVGSCWAFSTVENIEGQWALAGNNLTSLSAEQLVDCDATFDPNNLHQDCGVFGGWPYLAYQYIEKAGGIESNDDYPYCSGTGKCFPCVPKGYNKTRCGPPPQYCKKNESCPEKLDPTKFVRGLKVKSWVAIAKNETEMQSELVTRGPLSVLMNADGLQFYHSGVWDPILGCDPSSLDHAVLLVGYGTHKSILSSKEYWLIKNSWGTSWGQDGYFMLLRGKNECGISEGVTSAELA